MEIFWRRVCPHLGAIRLLKQWLPRNQRFPRTLVLEKEKKKTNTRRLVLARGGLVSRFHVVLIVCEIRLRSRQELSPG